MVGWLAVGAALIYLSPVLANLIVHSDLTQLWLENLSRGGYDPTPALIGGGAALALTVIGNVVWYQRFDSK
ncbi:MAG: hypothetical protein F6J97_25125 [Leptolyngbya sp. SIO4C1]|nr:hypothetical protein [Leptolyngbya sp. SIO4C1]